jgi:hypothetical protein
MHGQIRFPASTDRAWDGRLSTVGMVILLVRADISDPTGEAQVPFFIRRSNPHRLRESTGVDVNFIFQP